MQKFLKENEVCSKPFCDNEFHLNENEKWFLFQWLRTESRFETEAWATRNWPIGPSSFSCSLSFFHLRLTDIAGRGETVLEKGRACKHLFDQLSLPTAPPTSRKSVSRVKTVKCAVYEGFTHLLCLFDSVCEKPSVDVCCQNDRPCIMGYIWLKNNLVLRVQKLGNEVKWDLFQYSLSLPSPHLFSRNFSRFAFPIILEPKTG